MQKRVFVSSTKNGNLDKARRLLKDAVLEKISQEGYEPQEFKKSGLPKNWAWSFSNVDRVMRQCVGAVVFGFARWTVSEASEETKLLGEYNHYEGAVALTHGLPLLLLKENGVRDRGVVWKGGEKLITTIPKNADERWVESASFANRFNPWLDELRERKDVFLGYCSKSRGTAALIQLQLEKLGASVLNWDMDFRSGRSILSEIENARACSYAVFLFSEDDPLEGMLGGAAPRDNVVFEAGYFMSSKRCLIIRHGEAKMPADLGGNIYVHLSKTADVASIEGRLRDFLTNNL
jgi:hypothetical protein